MYPVHHANLHFIRVSCSCLWQAVLAGGLAGGEGTGESELGANSVDAVRRVQVLNYYHLVAGGHTFAGGDDGPSEEKLPDLLTVRLDNTWVERAS